MYLTGDSVDGEGLSDLLGFVMCLTGDGDGLSDLLAYQSVMWRNFKFLYMKHVEKAKNFPQVD